MISNQFSRNGMSLKATEYNIISELEALAMVTSKVMHLETMGPEACKKESNSGLSISIFKEIGTK